jgi:hypothetical protein
LRAPSFPSHACTPGQHTVFLRDDCHSLLLCTATSIPGMPRVASVPCLCMRVSTFDCRRCCRWRRHNHEILPSGTGSEPGLACVVNIVPDFTRWLSIIAVI